MPADADYSVGCEPVYEPGVGARPGRVTHCCFEHAGQTFGSLTDAPGQPARWKICGLGWRTSEVRMQPEEIPDDDHELVIERVCAIDVAKASGKVCVRTPHPNRPDRRTSRVWDVSATSRAVTELAEHLIGEGIERVTVESTSDYWRIWFYVLEAAGLDVQLVNAREVKNVPGRPKTDLLTELSAGSCGGCVRYRAGLARFAACDRRWGCASGFVRAGGAAAGLSRGDGRFVSTVSAR